MSLRHPVAKQVERSPGDKWARARVFPGIISARKVSLGELLAYANPRPVAEEGTKANPGGAAERHRNAEPGTALEAQCAIGTATDGFARVKERAAEPGAAAEGDALAGVMILNPIPNFPLSSTHLFCALGHSFPTRSLTRCSDCHQIT